ncbi:hypothetical protein SDC9_149473 [bioreactor metagenome]|uniref:Uncharacterized protein n=1 Tax=bioreactor metagenome TaxID=1076179 RepID=A0A645EMA7_9ZZZZ
MKSQQSDAGCTDPERFLCANLGRLPDRLAAFHLGITGAMYAVSDKNVNGLVSFFSQVIKDWCRYFIEIGVTLRNSAQIIDNAA